MATLKAIKMSQIKNWGVTFSSAIRYAADFNCQECDEYMFGFSDGWKYLEQVVGFSQDLPFRSSTPERNFGLIIIECPLCFERFWIHCSELTTNLYKEKCPNWPED